MINFYNYRCGCEECLWCDKCDRVLVNNGEDGNDNCFEGFECWAETRSVWVEMSYYRYGEIKD